VCGIGAQKRKAELVQSDTVGYYHRSKLCCLGISIKTSTFASVNTCNGSF